MANPKQRMISAIRKQTKVLNLKAKEIHEEKIIKINKKKKIHHINY